MSKRVRCEGDDEEEDEIDEPERRTETAEEHVRELEEFLDKLKHRVVGSDGAGDYNWDNEHLFACIDKMLDESDEKDAKIEELEKRVENLENERDDIRDQAMDYINRARLALHAFEGEIDG